MLNQAEATRFSPLSTPDGIYSQPFTSEELAELMVLAQYLLPGETVEPYIPSSVVEQAINWFSDWFIHYIERVGAENVIITYNQVGGTWFKDDLRQACLQKGFDFDSLVVRPIRVSTSSGEKQYARVKKDKFKWLDAETSIEGKIVISLDDIGDRGYTQRVIRSLAKSQGAKDVITVNLLEKLRPDFDAKGIKKKNNPDIALLMSQFLFLIGRGLDAGSDNLTRETAFRNARNVIVLQTQPQVTELPIAA